MKLLIDLGNTRLKWAYWEGLELRLGGAVAHARARLDFAALWKNIQNVESAWVASVAPAALDASVAQALHNRFDVDAQFVCSRAQACGVRNAYTHPERLGVDRFLGLIAAHATTQSPVVIANCGTALTLDAMIADGTHLGGLIAPSPALMQAALRDATARLGEPEAAHLVEFADTTDDAIESGCWLAGVALVERFVARVAQRVEAAPTLIISGGGGARLAELVGVPHRIDPELVLRGLAQLADSGG